MKQHVAVQDNEYIVEKLNDVRVNKETNIVECQVKWAGFEATEATWEPLQAMLEDVPKLVKSLERKLGKNTAKGRLLRSI